jgi:hypothetical protein
LDARRIALQILDELLSPDGAIQHETEERLRIAEIVAPQRLPAFDSERLQTTF